MLDILKKIAQIGIISEPRLDLQQSVHRIFGRSIAIRHVDAGSCNGCELEINALSNPYYNLEGYGIHFVASPRHADILLVTGPVSRHMIVPLQRTYDAMPNPKWVIALGDCGCHGGIFGKTYATCSSVKDVIPVHMNIPGCPPTPTAILKGILTLLQT
jgi:Ni,Fe-hydrogenase III small subunit